ncbi:site-specific tyrosine recombinase XerC (plasmid) [Rickettsiales bacterium Ac37b]|nr:site-specific tyrosine recombinase XerC [Rickettsiales bacterium Ac37b]
MNNSLTRFNSEEQSLSKHIDLINKAKDYAIRSHAQLTLIGYHKDWQLFEKWCTINNLSALPCHINTLIIYITDLAGQDYKVSTIERKIYAINYIHFLSNHLLNLKDRDFKIVFNGIKRSNGIAKKGKTPLLLRSLREIIANINTASTNIAIRDKALISFGWASAMRRSEIVALNWQDISFIDEGITVLINKSKTDQFGEGQKIAILYGNNQELCPVRNLKEWHKISSHNQPVFTSINKKDVISNKRLSDRDIARILKKRLEAIGLNAADFAGHSLRSGFITTAAKHSIPDHIIMKHSRHKTVQMLQVYTRDNSLIKDNPTSMVGL